MVLDKEQLKTWIAALRSGKYPQGKMALQSTQGYCCLGVACKVLIPEDKLELGAEGRLFGGFPDDQPHAPQWLTEINDDFKKKSKDKKSLSLLNDGEDYGKSFAQLADLLEQTYLTETTE